MKNAFTLAPLWESEFAYGQSVASPDSEQIEHVIAEQFMRNSVSVEQIQDRCVRRTGEGSHSDKIAQQVRDDRNFSTFHFQNHATLKQVQGDD